MSQRPTTRSQRAANRDAARRSPARPPTTVRQNRSRRDVPVVTDPPIHARRGVRLAIVVVVIAALFGGLALASAMARSGSNNPASANVDWPAAPSGSSLSDRLSSAGLQLLNTEGEALHIHQYLAIYIDGKSVAVPANIGIDQSNGTLSPIHTHDGSGVIHVESPTVQTFTLGQFFEVWGVQLTTSCIGDFCESGDSVLRMWVNGQQYVGDPRSLGLAEHQVIVIAFGPPSLQPNPIPSTYNWSGL